MIHHYRSNSVILSINLLLSLYVSRPFPQFPQRAQRKKKEPKKKENGDCCLDHVLDMLKASDQLRMVTLFE